MVKVSAHHGEMIDAPWCVCSSTMVRYLTHHGASRLSPWCIFNSQNRIDFKSLYNNKTTSQEYIYVQLD